MVVKLKFSALRQDYWYDHAIRLVLGGLATLLAGLVADAYGPAIGGLMLGFPAIFCASATLTSRNERKKKEKKGLAGAARGRQAAALDAAGAGWGSFAMLSFAACVWLLANYGPWISLATASIVWIAAAAALWCLRRKARSQSLHKHKTGESAEAPGS
jgi:membrane protein implicated in regulation of membrane protease activity